MRTSSRWYALKYDVGCWLRKRLFPPHQDRAFDWERMEEQWAEEEAWQRERYPVRFYLEKAWDAVSKWPRVGNILYWLRTHTYNRYHILDLSKAEPEDPNGYRWGWMDRDRLLVLAMFKVLRDFVELEKPWPVADNISKLEAEGDPNGELESLRHQQSRYEEVMELYRWWTVDRFPEREEWEARRDAAREAYKTTDTEAAREEWFRYEESELARETEMLERLIRARHYLWT